MISASLSLQQPQANIIPPSDNRYARPFTICIVKPSANILSHTLDREHTLYDPLLLLFRDFQKPAAIFISRFVFFYNTQYLTVQKKLRPVPKQPNPQPEFTPHAVLLLRENTGTAYTDIQQSADRLGGIGTVISGKDRIHIQLHPYH